MNVHRKESKKKDLLLTELNFKNYRRPEIKRSDCDINLALGAFEQSTFKRCYSLSTGTMLYLLSHTRAQETPLARGLALYSFFHLTANQ